MENQLIYEQVIELIENGIIGGKYKENSPIISTTQLSKLMQINHITIMKAYTLLVNDGVLYKKRGLGMFVSENAIKIIKKHRITKLKSDYKKLQNEAKLLGIKL
jgi:DNA-binding transcriptional regulator YhcF (GntR family)